MQGRVARPPPTTTTLFDMVLVKPSEQKYDVTRCHGLDLESLECFGLGLHCLMTWFQVVSTFFHIPDPSAEKNFGFGSCTLIGLKAISATSKLAENPADDLKETKDSPSAKRLQEQVPSRQALLETTHVTT